MLLRHRRFGWKYIIWGFTVFVISILAILLLHDHNNYDTIKMTDVMSSLHQETMKKMKFKSTNNYCDYSEILKNQVVLVPKVVSYYAYNIIKDVNNGGWSFPKKCNPLFSTAVILPYSNDIHGVHEFLFYIHIFLRKQLIHYQIYLVDQTYVADREPLSTSTLMNVGAMTAINEGFPCLIFHELDLLPLSPANIYACTELPRHMTTQVTYKFLYSHRRTSSAIAITSRHFKSINGLSNNRDRWADNLERRLRKNGISLCKFEKSLDLYEVIYSEAKQEFLDREDSDEILSLYRNSTEKDTDTDGLSSLNNLIIQSYTHLFSTHIVVHPYLKTGDYKRKMVKFEVELPKTKKDRSNL